MEPDNAVTFLQGVIEGDGKIVLFLIVIVVGVFFSHVQLKKIEFNPWDWLREKTGVFFGQVFDRKIKEIETRLDAMEARIDKLTSMLEKHTRESGERDAMYNRQRILSFRRDLREGIIEHTEEDFADIMSAIEAYEKFCDDNRNFRNNIAALSIRFIKDTYSARFLKGGKP